VDEEDIVLAEVQRQLARGFQEGQALDVAHRAADLDDDDVRALGSGLEAPLDLVGDVRDDLDGRPEEVPAALAREYRANDLSVIASGRPRIGELEELKLRGGGRRWVQRDILPCRNERGAVVGVVIIAVDVTKRKRAEDLATAKERAEREFIANVSHEFRTPVAAIKGFAQTLREGAWRKPAERARFLNIIEANADRLDAMVGDLLTLSALEGSAPIKAGAAALDRVAGERAKRALSRAERKGLTLGVSVPRGLRVKMNQAHLGQALEHLLDNAIKFTPPGGWVRLKARGTRREATIVVEDSGIGIPRADLARVFDRFYRVAKGAQSGSPLIGNSLYDEGGLLNKEEGRKIRKWLLEDVKKSFGLRNIEEAHGR